MVMRVLVSSCLLGQPVRYDGGSSADPSPILARWLAEGRIIPICPEVDAGLSIPRPAAEIQAGGGGQAVLRSEAAVRTASGEDVTYAFVRGACLALDLAERAGTRVAVLKEGSPSCGSRAVHDGSFSGVRIPGAGVTVALLQGAGIRVFGEDRLEEADRLLGELDGNDPLDTARSTP